MLKHAREAFGDAQTIAAAWQSLNYTAPPDFARALDQYEHFAAMLVTAGVEVHMLPEADGAGLDSIYVRDASVVCDRGVILARMGKQQRAPEPAAQGAAMRRFGQPIVGSIEAPGCLEGGDVLWLASRTLAVGRGYRTNDAGIAQLRLLLGDAIDDLIVVPLPHWRGPGTSTQLKPTPQSLLPHRKRPRLLP